VTTGNVKKQSWRDIVDHYLLNDKEAVLAFEGTEMGQPLLVRRPGILRAQIIIWSPSIEKILPSAAVILTPRKAILRKASWTDNPESLLILDWAGAISSIRRYELKTFLEQAKRAIEKLERQKSCLSSASNYKRFIRNIHTAAGQLLWMPNGPSASPYKPYWQISFGRHIWYVTPGRKDYGSVPTLLL